MSDLMFCKIIDEKVIGGFIIPYELEETLEKDTIISEDVYRCLKNINDLVLIDYDTEEMMVVEGGFSYQVIAHSLKTIEKLTKDNPKFIIKVIEIFKLNEYLCLDKLIEEKNAMLKEY